MDSCIQRDRHVITYNRRGHRVHDNIMQVFTAHVGNNCNSRAINSGPEPGTESKQFSACLAHLRDTHYVYVYTVQYLYRRLIFIMKSRVDYRVIDTVNDYFIQRGGEKKKCIYISMIFIASALRTFQLV